MNEPWMSGKVALVAGASKGIGAVTAQAFAEAGAAVVIGARHLDLLEGVAGRIKAAGGEALAVRADVTDEASMRGLVEAAMSTYGRLDAAFNNATDGPLPSPLADIDVAEFDRGIATNVRGTFLGMKFQIEAMLRGGSAKSGGSIVNMASVAGLSATAGLGAYVAGKSGIIGLTKVGALDYADQGIRVNVVAPGPILTEDLEAAGPDVQRLAAQAVPMHRVGAASEVADVVLWLCSPAAAYVTGSVIPIDGGQSAGRKPPQMFRKGEGMRPAGSRTEEGTT